jgi:hypothetical protein
MEIELPVAVVVDGSVAAWRRTLADARAALPALVHDEDSRDVRLIRFGLFRTAFGVRMNCLPKAYLPEKVWNEAWQAFYHFRGLLGQDVAISPEEWARRIEASKTLGEGRPVDPVLRDRAIKAVEEAMCQRFAGDSVRGAA